jgi:hypothetical protein
MYYDMTVSREEPLKAFIKAPSIDVRSGVDIDADTKDFTKGDRSRHSWLLE